MGGIMSFATARVSPTNINPSGGDRKIAPDIESGVHRPVDQTRNNERVKASELYRIVKTGNVDALEKLDRVSLGQKILSSRFSPAKNTLLHVAAQHGKEDMVTFIADIDEHQFLVSTRNWRGDTALHVAAKAGHLTTVTVLVENLKRCYQHHLLQATNNNGNTALHEALLFNSKDDSVAKYLIEHDPELLYIQNKKQESAMYLAVKAGFKSCISLARRQTPKDQQRLDELFKKNPAIIMEAIQKKDDTSVLEEIFCLSKDFTQLRDDQKRNPLHYAASLGYDKMAKHLLGLCTDYANQRDQNGSLPIHLACSEGHVKVVKLLLENISNQDELSDNLFNNNGSSILHVAAENGRDNVVKILVNNKNFDQYFINMQDNNGNTALHLATKNWKPRIVSTLTWDKRVDIKALNDKDETALDVAETNMPSECTNNQWLTRVALKAARTPRYQSSTTIEKGDTRNLTFYKEKATFRLHLSILVATLAFAAGFSLPNGHKYLESDTHSTSGIELILKRIALKIFIVSNIMSMYSSISSAVVLSWAQSGDLNLVNNALNFTLPLFWIALSMMSMTFMAGVYLVINEHVWLHIASLVMGVAFHSVLLFHCLVVFNPIASSNWVLRYLTYYPFRFLVLVNSSWPRLRDFTWSNKH